MLPWTKEWIVLAESSMPPSLKGIGAALGQSVFGKPGGCKEGPTRGKCAGYRILSIIFNWSTATVGKRARSTGRARTSLVNHGEVITIGAKSGARKRAELIRPQLPRQTMPGHEGIPDPSNQYSCTTNRLSGFGEARYPARGSLFRGDGRIIDVARAGTGPR